MANTLYVISQKKYTEHGFIKASKKESLMKAATYVSAGSATAGSINHPLLQTLKLKKAMMSSNVAGESHSRSLSENDIK